MLRSLASCDRAMTRALRNSPRGLVALVVLLSVVALSVLVIELAGWGPVNAERYRASGPDPEYATQGGSRQDVRAQHIENVNDEYQDSAYETCEARPLEAWAAILKTEPTAPAIARTFARLNFAPAFREGARRGCFKGLLGLPTG